jgi:transposase-like protein
MTPARLPNETEKAFNAFKIYTEVGGSVTRVARRLGCSLQNVEKWRRKYDWKARFNAQRLRDCQQKIQAEERAIERTAQITEERRARAAARAFAVAERMIERADEVMTEHPVSSVRLLATGVDVAAQVAGVARNYNVPAPTLEIVTQFIDQNGQPVAAPEPIENLSLDEIEALAAKCIRATEA